jgi:HEAT repeat protein
LRGVATESLGGTGGGPEVEQALLALLSDPLPALRFWAAHSLGAVGDRSALVALEALLTQPDAELSPFGTLHEEARAAIEAIHARETDG